MPNYFAQLKKTTLAYSISNSETTIRLNFLRNLDGTSITASDIGDYMTGTIDPGTSKEEIFSIASGGVTVNADGTVDITGVVRGLLDVQPYTTGGFSTDHGAGAVVVFSNNPQLYNQMANKGNANTFTQQNTFNGFAPQTNTDPVNSNDLTRLSYVQALVLGTLTTIDVVVPGTAGETIVDGNLIYLFTDNKWYKCDADTASTVDNVLLGIAKGAGVANAQITNGVLLQGVDNAQSGLTGGQVQYASNTAGGISSTAGTTEVTVGIAKSATELYFSPRFNQQLTEDQQDALLGTSGNPSNINRFVTDADTTGSGAVVRQSSLLTSKFGGDGSDGALTVASGTTNIDLGGLAFVVKNYTSISITGTGKVTFTNSHANGTVIILKSQGNVTLTSSTTPMIDASALGAAGGASVVSVTAQNGTAGSAGTSTFLSAAGGIAGQLSPLANTAATPAFSGTLFTTTRQKYTLIPVASGGGSGNITTTGVVNATSGAGGKGGGTLVIECAGAWNFTTANGISVAGVSGGTGIGGTSNTAYPNAGGGGGGGGGFFLALYNTLTANSGTVTVTGGTGGNSDSYNTLSGRSGGNGGGSLTAGTIGNNSNVNSFKTGGDGVTGTSTVLKNVDFT